VAGSVWPPAYVDHAPLAAMAMMIEASQWHPPEQIAAGQAAQLRVLVDHHVRHNPIFAERLRLAGVSADDIASPARLTSLPPLTRFEAQHLLETASIPAAHCPTAPVQSSGSSGIPVRIVKTQLTQLMWQAMTLRYHNWSGALGGRLACVRYGVGATVDATDWGLPSSVLHDTGPMRRIDVTATLEDQAKRLRPFKPDAVQAYPSNIEALLATDPEALASVSTFLTVGETVSDALRAELSRTARVYDCYSAEEVGYIALQCPDGPGYHVMAESLIVEIIDDKGSACAAGETGRVIVTDLHNFAMPVIRYDTGDFGEAGGLCPCGRGLPTINRIRGRWRGMLTLPDGSRHWPLTGIYGFRDIAAVRQYQMIQHAPDRIELRFLIDQPLSMEQDAAMQTYLQGRVGHGIGFTIICFADRLPPGSRGKTDEFISLIGES
jgi:phenylacetate-CoA ligase